MGHNFPPAMPGTGGLRKIQANPRTCDLCSNSPVAIKVIPAARGGMDRVTEVKSSNGST